MYKIVYALILICSISLRAQSALVPKEGATLNYRIIGFSFPAVISHTGKYKLEIAAGNYNTTDQFAKNICVSQTSDKERMIAEVPAFGRAYTWRIVDCKKGTAPVTGELHHFSTGMPPNADTNLVRLRISDTYRGYKDSYVFIDGTGVLYDMNGQPVWYLPKSKEIRADSFSQIGDLKASPQHTITFLTARKSGDVYEVNYDGAMLWKGPNNGEVSGDSTEHYHHDFCRLNNGHYMVLGDEYVPWKLPATIDSITIANNSEKIVRDVVTNTLYQPMEFGTVIEYDQQGNVIWKWKSSAYFKVRDPDSFRAGGMLYDLDVHENAFYFDEKARELYVSFRDLNRIVKVSYPGGKDLSGGDEITKDYEKETEHGSFCHQHSCKKSKDGYMYLFNNNVCNDKAPTLLMMKEAKTGKAWLEKKWEYTCKKDSSDMIADDKFIFTMGGNVIELADGRVFGSLSNEEYSQVFIVNKDKKMLWCAYPEKRCSAGERWKAIFSYRASIIGRKELEQLVWDGKK